MGVDHAAVRATYLDGVRAVGTETSGFLAEQWAAPACGRWSATETVRHLAAVTDWYHGWLDRALAGDATPPFRAAEIDAMTEQSLEVDAHLDGPAAVERFDRCATSYLERVVAHWDLPYAYPFGGVTAGLHAGAAAAEWHLHAWDLSTATGTLHEPSDPTALFVAAGRCVAAADGDIKGAVLARIVPIAGRRDPWQQMLRRSGRGG